ncbi:MAG: hypothetical protein ABL984_19125 [Pyrinomonadaceae bacterium]
MEYIQTFHINRIGAALFRAAVVVCLVLGFSVAAYSSASFTTSADNEDLEVNDSPEMSVIAVAKTVIVRQSAKDVFVFGGDVIIEGNVSGDVGVIGGTITQKEGAFIGGDVIVIGGAYKPDGQAPLRTVGKETIVFGILEDELRNLGRNPGSILSPSLTPAFFAQRILSALFWFVVTLGFATIAPGAVSRAIARTKLTPAKVAGFGLAGLIGSLLLVSTASTALPEYLSVIVWLMVVGLLMLAYLFGRVTLQLSIGKYLQKHLLPNYKANETVAILFGVVLWTILLSFPYIWILAVLAVFAAGVGLVITARNNVSVRPS